MSERAKATVKAPAEKTEKAAARIRQPECISSAPSPYEHITQLQRIFGNQAVQRLYKAGLIRAKLAIGPPNDIYEQKADQVADQVMRMPERGGEGRRLEGEGRQGGGQWMADGGFQRDTLQLKPG